MRWPLQPLQPFQQTQLQPPFGQSVDSLCHPWFTTTNVSYRFPILKLPPPPCAVLLVGKQMVKLVKHGSTQLLSWWNWWNDTNSYQLISRILSKHCQWCQDDIELLISIDDNDVKCKNSINLGHSSASKVPPTSSATSRYVQCAKKRVPCHDSMTAWSFSSFSVKVWHWSSKSWAMKQIARPNRALFKNASEILYHVHQDHHVPNRNG